MPVPGPRTQWRPDSGYRNPEQRLPDFINLWLVPGPIWWPGESPGTSVITLRGCKLAWGQIRRLWRQKINYFGAQAPFSWTANSPAPGGLTGEFGNGGTGSRPSVPYPGFEITRALRYMTRSVYAQAGTDNTRFEGLHEIVNKWNRGKQTTLGQGQRQYSPTVRNRLTSFGQRVPTLNEQLATDEQFMAQQQSLGPS